MSRLSITACMALVSAALSLTAITRAAADDLVAAVLPLSRSATVGEPVTAFATVINTSGHALSGCTVYLPSFTGYFNFQETDPSTNAPVGIQDTAFDMPAGAVQTLVVSLTPTTVLAPSDQHFVFQCNGSTAAASLSGLDTLLLSADTTQPPDVVALALTPTADGVLAMTPNGPTQAFVMATVNLGATFQATVSLTTGDIDGTVPLPVTSQVCQTDPVTSVCLAAPSDSVTLSFAAGATPTFAFFMKAQSAIPFFPSNVRAFVRINDQTGATRGETSIALKAVATLQSGQTAGGLYAGTYRETSGPVVGYSNTAILAVSEDGELRGVTLENDDTVTALFSGQVAVGNDLTFATTGTVEAANGFTLASGGTISDLTFTGVVSPHQFLAGTYSDPGETGAFFVGYFASGYERPSSLAAVSGAWNLRTLSGAADGTLTVATDGSFSGRSLEGCVWNGTVATIDTRYNAYRIHLNVTGCNPGSGTYEGLGLFFDTNAANDSFQFELSGGTVAEINYITRF